MEHLELVVVLDPRRAATLTAIAARVGVEVPVLASGLLAHAIDGADEAIVVSAILDGIDGAYERAITGRGDAASGNIVALDDL